MCIKINSYLIRILLVNFIICQLACKSNKYTYNHRFGSLETHRQIAIKEKLAEEGHPDSYKQLFYKTKFTIPDSVSNSDNRIKYINQNPDIPEFIIKALINREIIEMMTIGEFYLCRPDLLKDTIITPSMSNPHILNIGFKKYFDPEKNAVIRGPYWMFKNGFFWEGGQI